MDDDRATLVLEIQRLRRVIEALSVVSLGDFDLNAVSIETSQDDEFAVLEETVNIVARELAETREQSERQLRQIQESRHVLEERLATIELQRLAIRDLSTPMLEVWENILALPIVGMVDAERSIDMTARLLQQIVEKNYQCLILDVTGVNAVDPTTAGLLIKMITASRLLGTYCVITGVQREIARALIAHGVELHGIKTLRSLKEGLRDCFAYLRAPDGRTTRRPAASATREKHNVPEK
jgi:rsbT co-antagonist protein RsbR